MMHRQTLEEAQERVDKLLDLDKKGLMQEPELQDFIAECIQAKAYIHRRQLEKQLRLIS